MSGLNITVDGYDLEQLDRAWEQTPERVRDALTAATWEAEMLLLREIKEDTPVGATSNLRQSIHAETPAVLHESVEGIVGTSALHAIPVEMGTRPHFPPVEPLIDWVQAKLDIRDESDAEAVAFAIARKIAARGTKGQFMFRNNFHELRPAIEAMYARAHENILAGLADG
ncbi:MAG: HK97 gp10 family phage protein [Candidatus Thiodiazotropha sp. (ex Dulcina madagascariensis)]|nr:HK97 gp10 family phage protein [Candidatus Thiodiazotropha sp. (ex Dulcina madagascariensis)]